MPRDTFIAESLELHTSLTGLQYLVHIHDAVSENAARRAFFDARMGEGKAASDVVWSTALARVRHAQRLIREACIAIESFEVTGGPNVPHHPD